MLNLIWLIFGGLVMALGYAVVALLMFILISRSAGELQAHPVSLTPFGRDIVDLDQARRLGYAAQVSVPAEPSRRAA